MIKIISCFWNASRYIEGCINSVKNQSLIDFKMYLIDDVSTDDTIEKIKSLIDNDKRFELIENKEKKFKLKNIDELRKNKGNVWKMLAYANKDEVVKPRAPFVWSVNPDNKHSTINR